MRPLLLAVALAATPAAADARATLLEGRGDRPRAALEVPGLELRALPVLAAARDDGGGAAARRGRQEPVLSLVLGIFPGFGLGHVLAESPHWPVWLVVDAVLLVPLVVADDGAQTAFFVLTVVERVLEGIDAYRQAQGRPGLFGSRDLAPPSYAAIPAGARNLAASAGGLRF